MKDILKKLANTKPLAPQGGWFQQLHSGHLVLASRLDELIKDQGWNELAATIKTAEIKRSDVLMAVMNRHGWTAGHLGLIPLAEACWTEMHADQRGAFIAGLSEYCMDWVSSHLRDATFSPESACQIACNAIRHKRSDVLIQVLESKVDWQATIHRQDLMRDWSEELKQLSHRVIDLILEAALIRNHMEGVRLALSKGASPDIPMWRLENSYNEKHCALSWAIANEQKEIAELLLNHGASAVGIPYAISNHPLYLAIRNEWDDLAKQLMDRGAAFSIPSKPEQTASIKPGGSESEIVSPQGRFFGVFKDELEWAKKEIGSLIPLASADEKASFYIGHAQGGNWTTFLNAVIDDLPRLKHYESLGLDTRLTAEELCSAISSDAFDGLAYLLSKHGPDIRDRALSRILRHTPDFGASRREIETLPQSDAINTATGFSSGNLPFLEFSDGSKLFVDLEAIAPVGHRHGPCLEGHFWLHIDEATYRRQQDQVVVTALSRRWSMTKMPENRYQLDDLLPCIKEVGRKFIRLGVTIGNLCYRIRSRKHQDLVQQWMESATFQSVLDEAFQRIKAQDATNARPRTPVLTEEELVGYPTVFWPYLVRLPNGLIGMTESSCRDNPDLLDIYQVWAKQNKTEDTFVPDPRVLSWEGWREVPPELKPFFEFDAVLQRPGVRHKAKNDYEKAMIHKAVAWWNAWMGPRILAQIEQLQGRSDDAKG